MQFRPTGNCLHRPIANGVPDGGKQREKIYGKRKLQRAKRFPVNKKNWIPFGERDDQVFTPLTRNVQMQCR